jgi:7-cyano-7-deazaguanine synthase
MKNRCVVLLSGGLDSSTVLSLALAEGGRAYALSFDYNQRHRIELDSARKVASSLGVEKHLVVKFDLREFAGSALTSNIEVPKRAAEGATGSTFPQSDIPVTYVPARNTIFLSFALAWAEVIGADEIFIGANAIDYSGYPDCRPEYLDAYEKMANLATKASVEGALRFRIRAPLIAMKKSDIIRKGTELGLDYSLTWSCYDPQPVGSEESGVRSEREKRHEPSSSSGLKGKDTLHSSLFAPHSFRPCGRCDSCVLRLKGFAEAGIRDPLTK